MKSLIRYLQSDKKLSIAIKTALRPFNDDYFIAQSKGDKCIYCDIHLHSKGANDSATVEVGGFFYASIQEQVYFRLKLAENAILKYPDLVEICEYLDETVDDFSSNGV